MCYNMGVLNYQTVTITLLDKQIVTIPFLSEETEFALNAEEINTWFYILYNKDTDIFFLGQTKYCRKDKRHNDSVYTKLIGSWNLQGHKHTTYWIGITQVGHHQDKKVHRKIEALPNCETNTGFGSNEVFRLSGFGEERTVQVCLNFVKEIFGVATLEKSNQLVLKHLQKDFIIKINSAWEKYKQFLLNAKCRSGKSIMVLSHIVEAKYKFSIVCCRSGSPRKGWEEDQEYFPSVKLLNIQDKDYKDQIDYWMTQDGIQIVVWGTVQSLTNRVEELCKYHVDFIAIDEAHIGSQAQQFTSLYNKFNETQNEVIRLLYITGTAGNLLPSFNNENTFTYSYWQEQLDVRKGLFGDEYRPKMHVHFAKYMCEEYKKIFGDDADAMGNIFTLKEKNKGKDSEFLYDILPRSFAIKFYGPEQSKLRLKDRLFQGNYHMMAMDGVGHCHAFKKIVECYIPTLVVTGDTDEDQESINNFCLRNSRALILTCSANVLGMTCKYIDTVINCRGGKSDNFWKQLSFRGGSGDHDWHVIDFDAQRGLRILCQSYQEATDIEPELAKYQMLELVNINDWFEKFIELDQSRIEQILSIGCENINSSFANIVNGLDLEDINFFDLALKSNLTDVVSEESLNDNGANNRSCIRRLVQDPTLNNEKEKSNNHESQNVKTVKALLESIPLVMTYILSEDTKVCTINSIIQTEIYKNNTGDYYKIIEKVIAKNPNSKNAINDKISAFSYDIKKQLRDSKAKTLDKYGVSLQTQKNIPINLFDTMIDDCKDLSQTYMFGDPSGSHTARLLERGVDPRNLTVWESCDSHRNRVKYIDNNVKVVDSHPNMKFTAILANPPYKDDSKAKNNKLWHKIINQHLPLLVPGGDMCEVTPASVLSITGEGKKFLKLFSTLYNLVEIDYTADQYFTESVSICSWHLVNEPYQGKTKVITKEGEFEWDLRNGVPVFGDYVLKQDILLKIANSNHRRIPLKIGQEIATKDYVPDGKYEIYHSSKKVKRTNVIPTTGDILKFIVPFSSTYKNGGIFISNGYVGMLNCWCPIASEEEGNRLNKIFDLNIIQFYIDNYKKSAGFTASIKNGEVPDITDYNNLPEQFGFTEEEVDYLKRINVL